MSRETDRLELCLQEDILVRVDQWRSRQGDMPSRAESIVRLTEIGLNRTAPEIVRFSAGDKLIISMLCDLFTHFAVKVRDEQQRELLADIMAGGHYWALGLAFPSLFDRDEDDMQNVTLVFDVLEMWDFVETGYQQLSQEDKAVVEKQAAQFGKSVQFTGFDGNYESEMLGIAQLLVGKLGRFSRFKGHDLNAHMPTIETHRRMLLVFAPLRKALVGSSLNANQITLILKARDRNG